MSEGTTGEAEVIHLRHSIETQMRRRILEAIEVVLEEELTAALGKGRYERGDARRGYRNGHQARRITTAVGAQTLDVPRGRIVDPARESTICRRASGYP
jgi:transposase-like protein